MTSVSQETDLRYEQPLDFKFVIVVAMILEKVGLDTYTRQA